MKPMSPTLAGEFPTTETGEAPQFTFWLKLYESTYTFNNTGYTSLKHLPILHGENSGL